MTPRLERILVKLAAQYAPHLTPPGWDRVGDRTDRLQKLARQMAAFNILVLMAEVPPDRKKFFDAMVAEWIKGYGAFYNLLAQKLFPSFSRVSAFYADDRQPPVVVINGEATPVIQVLAGLITPYLAARQSTRPSELELRGLMQIVMDELEAEDLPRAVYGQIHGAGVEIVRDLLNIGMFYVSLTVFDRPILSELEITAPADGDPSAPTVPVKAAAPPPAPPVRLPEQDGGRQQTAAEEALAPSQERLQYELERMPEPHDHAPTEEMFRIEVPLVRPERRLPLPKLRKPGSR
jgi:hypothetical protein